MLKQAGRPSEVANLAEHDREDLLHALSSIVYALYARLYGQQRAKRATEQMIQALDTAEKPHTSFKDVPIEDDEDDHLLLAAIL